MSLEGTDLYFRIYIYFVSFVLGTVMGSFLNCCAYRICHNMSIVKGRSVCDECGHVLGVKDLVPIFSYLFNKGRCRYCGAKLNIRYLISEVISGIVYLLVVIKFGLTLKMIEYLILCSLMLCASFADLEDFIIPDRLIVMGIINRIIFILLDGNIKKELFTSLLSSLVICVPLIIMVIIMSKILKRDAMGGGDIKLFFMVAMYYSISENILSVLLSCIIGLAFGIITKRTDEEFPFGPSICMAYFITLLTGSGIINWYLGLF